MWWLSSGATLVTVTTTVMAPSVLVLLIVWLGLLDCLGLTFVSMQSCLDVNCLEYSYMWQIYPIGNTFDRDNWMWNMCTNRCKRVIFVTSVPPWARLSVPNDTTALTVYEFWISAGNLVGWCTVSWSRLLFKITCLANLNVFHGTWTCSMIGIDQAWGTMLPL